MKHKLPRLSYKLNALEPALSRETLKYHYGKHQLGYIDKLNELIIGTDFEEMTLLNIVRYANGDIFNNAAQAWNHEFYWNSLSPQKTQAKGALRDAIDDAFGSLDDFNSEFIKQAKSIFGSGWAWLVSDPHGRLSIECASNSENPIRGGKLPLLTLDVWEHAYYIDYRNNRERYLESLDKLLNWNFANTNYSAAISGRDEIGETWHAQTLIVGWSSA